MIDAGELFIHDNYKKILYVSEDIDPKDNTLTISIDDTQDVHEGHKELGTVVLGVDQVKELVEHLSIILKDYERERRN